MAYSTLGIAYEARYLDATAYTGTLGGLKIAAEASPDTHGAERGAAIQAIVGGRLGAALANLSVVDSELSAATMVLVQGDQGDGRDTSNLQSAVLARRTVAIVGFARLELDCPGLGEVQRTQTVALHLSVHQPIATITLYKEGAPVKTWNNATSADFSDTITTPTAYVWGLVDGPNRAMTSALWFEPSPTATTAR
jgi:hypothetical protein